MLKNPELTRQLDLLPISCLGEEITIIGAGAIGGWTALALSKMGFGNITVLDDDEVSIENMNCQFFRHKDVGRKKVDALKELILDFSGFRIEGTAHRFSRTSSPARGIVISAVDSMSARRDIWEAHKGSANTKMIIDPRMGAENALLYVMNPMSSKDQESYEKALYSDDNAVSEPCTRKSTAYCALPLSGLVAAQVKALVRGEKYSRVTQWDIPKGAFQAWQS